MNDTNILGRVTVFQAIAEGMADDDDPLLCWGDGECAHGYQHIAGELFTSWLPSEHNILRCCCCGKEFHPADDFELTLYRAKSAVSS